MNAETVGICVCKTINTMEQSVANQESAELPAELASTEPLSRSNFSDKVGLRLCNIYSYIMKYILYKNKNLYKLGALSLEHSWLGALSPTLMEMNRLGFNTLM